MKDLCDSPSPFALLNQFKQNIESTDGLFRMNSELKSITFIANPENSAMVCTLQNNLQ